MTYKKSKIKKKTKTTKLKQLKKTKKHYKKNNKKLRKTLNKKGGGPPDKKPCTKMILVEHGEDPIEEINKLRDKPEMVDIHCNNVAYKKPNTTDWYMARRDGKKCAKSTRIQYIRDKDNQESKCPNYSLKLEHRTNYIFNYIESLILTTINYKNLLNASINILLENYEIKEGTDKKKYLKLRETEDELSDLYDKYYTYYRNAEIIKNLDIYVSSNMMSKLNDISLNYNSSNSFKMSDIINFVEADMVEFKKTNDYYRKYNWDIHDSRTLEAEIIIAYEKRAPMRVINTQIQKLKRLDKKNADEEIRAKAEEERNIPKFSIINHHPRSAVVENGISEESVTRKKDNVNKKITNLEFLNDVFIPIEMILEVKKTQGEDVKFNNIINKEQKYKHDSTNTININEHFFIFNIDKLTEINKFANATKNFKKAKDEYYNIREAGPERDIAEREMQEAERKFNLLTAPRSDEEVRRINRQQDRTDDLQATKRMRDKKEQREYEKTMEDFRADQERDRFKEELMRER